MPFTSEQEAESMASLVALISYHTRNQVLCTGHNQYFGPYLQARICYFSEMKYIGGL